MKPQIVFIHGAMTFRNHSAYMAFLKTRDVSIERKQMWNNEYLEENLSSHFDVIRPRMPRSENAKYNEWSIHFQRHLPFLRDSVILIGFSLGATFLVKWLSKNSFPKRLNGVFLVAPPFDNSDAKEEYLAGGFVLRGGMDEVRMQCANVHFFFSKSDPIIPFQHCEKFRKMLPEAFYHTYEDMGGHFQIQTFPDIVESIRKTVK